MTNEFDDLFVNKEEINRDLLKEVLKGKVKLAEDGSVIFEEEHNPMKKIILYLLANKVFVMKQIKTEESEGPTNIYKNTGIAEGTAMRYVRELEKNKLLARTKEGRYWVPNHALHKIKDWLNK